MSDKIVIYHGACRDGFCAAWVAYTHGWNDASFYPAFHGAPITVDVTDKDVLVLDFSWPRPIMDEMARMSRSLLVIDHHKTAEAALKDAPYAIFDMERSGAGLAWDVLTPTKLKVDDLVESEFKPRRPWLVKYVEDRDLWRWALPESRQINAYIAVLNFDFETWSVVSRTPSDQIIQLGAAALAKTEQYVREVSNNARAVMFEGHLSFFVNAPQVDISELLERLLDENHPLAVGWWQRQDGLYVYSLRSTTLDVSEIAKRYGGGGHRASAGFQLQEMLVLT